MQTLCPLPPYDMVIRNELDVVMMRQDIRQKARVIGLGPAQQAKIAAAISAVARGILSYSTITIFTIQTSEAGARPAFEISCIAPLAGRTSDAKSLEQTLHFDEARLLVDQAQLAPGPNGALLTLRMWLTT